MIRLTNESFDSKRFNLHVDKQTTVGFHQRWGQSKRRLGVTQLDDTINNTVNQTETKISNSNSDLMDSMGPIL